MRTLFFIVVVFLGVSAFLASVWTKGGLMLATGEEGPFLANLAYTTAVYKSDWQEISLGMNQTGFLRPRWPFVATSWWLQETIGLNVVTIQRLWFGILLFSSLLAAFGFFYHLFTNRSYQMWGATISSLYYVFNPFVAVHIWNRFLYTLMFSLPLVPMSLAIFDYGVTRKKFYPAVLFALPSLVFSAAFGSPAVVLLLWGSVLIIWLARTIGGRPLQLGWAVLYLVICVGVWAGVNSWWLRPVWSFGGQLSTAYNLDTFKALSRSYTWPYTLRLTDADFLFTSLSWGRLYTNWFFQFISWLVPLVVVITVIVRRQDPTVRVLAALGGVGLFVVKGASGWGGQTLVWLMQMIPILQLWRNPLEKMGLMVVVAYAGIVGIAAMQMRKAYWGTWAVVLFTFGVCGIYLWPVWLGRVFGLTEAGIGVEIPAHYLAARSWLGREVKEFRLLSLPAAFGDGAVYQWGRSEYRGSEPLNLLLGLPVVSQVTGDVRSDTFYQSYLKWWPGLPMWKVAGMVSAKYVMLNSEISGEKLGLFSPQQTSQLLTSYVRPSPDRIAAQSNCLEDNSFPVCTLPEGFQNWEGSKYLHLGVISPTPQKLEVHVIDQAGRTLRFDGQSDPDYILEGSDRPQSLILPLFQPTEGSLGFNFGRISRIKFFASTPVKTVSLWPDRGVEKRQFKIKPSTSFGPLQFYEVDSEVRVERVFATRKILGIDRQSQIFSLLSRPEVTPGQQVFVPRNKFVELASILGSDPVLPKIVYHRLSPSQYRVQVRGASSPFLLVFHETYHPGWRLIKSGQLLPHFEADGYANGYLVSDSGDFALELVFRI